MFTGSEIKRGAVYELWRKKKLSVNAGIMDGGYYSALAGYEIFNKSGFAVDLLAGAGSGNFKDIDFNAGASISLKF